MLSLAVAFTLISPRVLFFKCQKKARFEKKELNQYIHTKISDRAKERGVNIVVIVGKYADC